MKTTVHFIYLVFFTLKLKKHLLVLLNIRMRLSKGWIAEQTDKGKIKRDQYVQKRLKLCEVYLFKY